MVGSFGHAMILVGTIALLAILTPLFFLYAAHIYVTTLTMSSGGEDRFRWPREGFMDWFGQGMTVFGVLFIWSILALMAAGAMSLILPAEWVVGVWLAVVVLLAPISLCSVMTAPSPLLFLFPPLVGRMLRQGKGLLYVYAVTTPLLAVAIAGVWLIVARRNPLGILIVGIGLPPALLLHARAWGRFAWFALNFDRKPRKKKSKPKPAADEEILAVDLEPFDADAPDYMVHPEPAPAGERLATMAEHYAIQHEYDRKVRERGGIPNPDVLAAPAAPTFRTALGEKVISFVFSADGLGVWFSFALFSLIEMAVIFLLVNVMP